jgi:hypothetical protein
MRLMVAPLALAALAASAAACGGSGQPGVVRTVDVSSLTFAEVQQRAFAAIQRQGEVYHLVSTYGDEGSATYDLWVDAERNVARGAARGSETIDLQYEGGRATLMEERFYDSPCDPCGEHAAASFAPHLGWILDDGAKDRSVDEGAIHGAPTIKVRVKREYGGDYRGDATATIHLDESFLPVEMRVDPPGPLPDQMLAFDGEFIARETLPADFFSRDAVKALAGGPRADVEAAAAAGLDVYWLEMTYEDMTLRDESRFYPEGLSEGSKPELTLSYGPAELSRPAPCVQIRVRELGAPAPVAVPEGTAPFATVTVGDEAATLYRAPRVSLPVPPPDPSGRGSDDDATFPPDVTPAATVASDRTVLADSGEFYAGVIETNDTVIEVAANCGPIGSNVYRTEEAFRRLISSLRQYEPASE